MCGGTGQSTDRAQELDAYGNLNKAGTVGADTGATATGAATDYYTKLLSGNPATVAAATQPEQNAKAGQVNQERQVIANQGGARTGGTNAESQQLTTNADAGTEDAIAKARGSAAPALVQIGNQETGQGIQASSDLGQQATANRAESAKLHADAVQNWSKLIAGAFDGTGIIPAAGGWQP